MVRPSVHRGGVGRTSSSSTIDVVSPTTEEVIGRVPEAKDADIDRAVASAKDAFEHGPWPRMTPSERAAVLSKAAEAIRNDMQGIAELISNEMGSPVSWGLLAQFLAPTMILDYYAGLGSTLKFDTIKDGLLGPVLVAKEPVGVVAAITPWNVLSPGRGQVGSCPLVREHGGLQARSRDAARCQPAGRDPGDGRTAKGRPQRGPGRT